MDEDRITALLEEIRDLQRRLVDSHQQALRNQQEAIQEQRNANATEPWIYYPRFVRLGRQGRQ